MGVESKWLVISKEEWDLRCLYSKRSR